MCHVSDNVYSSVCVSIFQIITSVPYAPQQDKTGSQFKVRCLERVHQLPCEGRCNCKGCRSEGRVNCKRVRSEGRGHGKGCRKCLGNYGPQIPATNRQMLRAVLSTTGGAAGTGCTGHAHGGDLGLCCGKAHSGPRLLSPLLLLLPLASFLSRCVCACGRGCMCVSTCAQYICVF